MGTAIQVGKLLKLKLQYGKGNADNCPLQQIISLDFPQLQKVLKFCTSERNVPIPHGGEIGTGFFPMSGEATNGENKISP